jgi:arginase family enzyme
MRTQIIQVPYDSGYKDYRMGRGPGHILRHLKAEKNFPVDEVEVQDRFALEVGTSFAVARQLAEKVCNVADRGDFPLVLAGGCISCVGTLAGLGAPPPAIIWLDAHGDFQHSRDYDQRFSRRHGAGHRRGQVLGQTRSHCPRLPPCAREPDGPGGRARVRCQ